MNFIFSQILIGHFLSLYLLLVNMFELGDRLFTLQGICSCDIVWNCNDDTPLVTMDTSSLFVNTEELPTVLETKKHSSLIQVLIRSMGLTRSIWSQLASPSPSIHPLLRWSLTTNSLLGHLARPLTLICFMLGLDSASVLSHFA